MQSKSKFLFLVLLLTMTGNALHAFAQTDDQHLAAMRKAGEVRAAVGSAPPHIIVSPSGKAAGSTVDLVNLALTGLGLPESTPVLLDWSAQIPALQANQVDMVGAAFPITAATCKVVLYSTPIFANQYALFVQAGNPKRLTSFADAAQNHDIKLVLQNPGGAPQHQYALKLGVKREQFLMVPDLQAGIDAVTSGRAHAFAIGQFVIPNAEQKGLEVIVDRQSRTVGYGVIFRKEDKQFRDLFNEQLIGLLKSGTIQKLYAKYGMPNGEDVAKLLATFTKASDVEPGCE